MLLEYKGRGEFQEKIVIKSDILLLTCIKEIKLTEVPNCEVSPLSIVSYHSWVLNLEKCYENWLQNIIMEKSTEYDANGAFY